jgi:hypothetical protein
MTNNEKLINQINGSQTLNSGIKALILGFVLLAIAIGIPCYRWISGDEFSWKALLTLASGALIFLLIGWVLYRVGKEAMKKN